MDFPAAFKPYLRRVEAGLDRLLPDAATPPGRLHAAMRYSISAGGKRIRPVLLLAAANLGKGKPAGDPIAAAVAVECIHTYSLIHDDLPCMDDDDLRRGKPTAHRAFDEATALLAGDALLTHAFALLATRYSRKPALATALAAELAEAAGSRRLIGGQMADLLAEGEKVASADAIDFIHLNKTAAMIEASLVMGGLCGGLDRRAISTLRAAGRSLGLAFQAVDDILDVTVDTARLGKTAGKDVKAGKATFVSLYGLEKARKLAAGHSAAAVRRFRKRPGGAPFLVAVAEALAGRGN